MEDGKTKPFLTFSLKMCLSLCIHEFQIRIHVLLLFLIKDQLLFKEVPKQGRQKRKKKRIGFLLPDFGGLKPGT